MRSQDALVITRALYCAAGKGHLEGVRKAIADGVDPKDNSSRALREAAWEGQIECVRRLIPVSDTKVVRAKLVEGNWRDAVALLDSIVEEETLKAKHLKPTGERARVMSLQDALKEAAKTGDLEGIRNALADGADPKFLDSWTLRWAVEYGHVDCVRELIPVSDPKALDSLTLRMAATFGHIECVRELIPVSDTKMARAKLVEGNWRDAVALLDSFVEEEALKAKHLKQASGRTSIGL